jgi:LysM repeat protein
MNNQNSLVPQGSFLEQKNKNRARVKLYVFVVLAIHGVGLLALLMQGCNKTPEQAAAPPEATNTTSNPTFEQPTNAPTAAVPGSGAPDATAVPPAPPAGATDYKLVQGDTFGALAKRFHVPVKAIQDANPGLDPTKLQIGQTIHIPPSPAPAPPGTVTGAAAVAMDTATGEKIYTVKSGDTLTSIAHDNHVSLRALRATNDLKTDRLNVGQKLKIPKPTLPTEPPAAPGASTSAPPAAPR